jgi:CheY-like chemotaxis protein
MKPVNILLVEDSPSDVRLVREALREAAIPVHLALARDGVDAIDYLRGAERAGNLPELIVLDLNLPRINGHEVLAQVKKSPVLKRIPVVIMTSSRAPEDINEAYALDANCYVAKPSDLHEFIRVMRSIENFWLTTATLPDSFAGYHAQSQANMMH